MGRLISSVREAEERLAGLARALQAAWEEELAEAATAREAAQRSIERAEAMADAALALGRRELVQRFDEVVKSLEGARETAVARLEELGRVEKRLGLRQEEPALPPARTKEEPTPAPLVIELAPVPEPARPPPPPAVQASAPAPKSKPLPPAAAALSMRVEELERVAARLPREVLEPALEELVAAARLVSRQHAGPAEELLARLRQVAEKCSVSGVFGFKEGEYADWGKLAAEARARRLAAVARAKARRSDGSA